MNGIDFIKEVRQLPGYKFMPILFLTTESQQAKRAEAIASGAPGWLVKPATADQLPGEFQSVIKPLGQVFRNIRGLAGSTPLGSGEVSLILDVQALAQLCSAAVARHPASALIAPANPSPTH